MSEQDGRQPSTLQRPTTHDPEAWKTYWKAEGQTWRTEPEIDVERQKYLAERRSITPDIRQGIYPFKDIKLSRADVEWLLVTHENRRGPVDWSDEKQRERMGLDLRGANLCFVDLSNLPLTRMKGGLAWHAYGKLPWHEWSKATGAQNTLATVLLTGANLKETHLEGASLRGAHLEDANLKWTHLEDTDLREAHLEGSNLRGTFFEHTLLAGCILSNKQHIGPDLVDVRWGNTNLTVVNWSQLVMPCEEYFARQKKQDGKRKDKTTRLHEYEDAVRANRQLAVALQAQALNEDAARFTYRTQQMLRKVYWYQRKFSKFVGSLFLNLLSGYGYKPGRCFIAYLVVIFAFATAYFIIGRTVGPVLSPLGSFVFSMTSFHGRGFFPGGIGLDDPLTVLAALEAFVGLLIEVTFIATLTQRLFGK